MYIIIITPRLDSLGVYINDITSLTNKADTSDLATLQGAILVKSFSASLTGWTAASPSYFLNIQDTLTGNGIAVDKILRVDVTKYIGSWQNFNFQIYDGSLYIFSDKNVDTTATLRVVYLP